MKMPMSRSIGQLKVLDAVIRFVPIFMMNLFTILQFSAKMLGHNKTVFQDVFFIMADQNIATGMHTSSAFPRGIFFSHTVARQNSQLGCTLARTTARIFGFGLQSNELKTTNHTSQRYTFSSRSGQNFRSIASTACSVAARQIVPRYDEVNAACASTKPACFEFIHVVKAENGDPAKSLSSQVQTLCHGAIILVLYPVVQSLTYAVRYCNGNLY
jgi:hypothetical protein